MKLSYKKIAFFFLIGFGVTFAQTDKQAKEIAKDYDLNKMKSFSERLEDEYLKNYKKALETAQEKGWAIKGEKDGNYFELQGITADGFPIYYTTYNSGSALVSGINKINSGGSLGLDLNGQDMIVGVWDGGAVRSTHQDLTGRVTQKDNASFSVTEGSKHATHVTGTVAGSGFGNPIAKGMAYEANIWANNWQSDSSEMMIQASTGQLLVSNHSYGTSVIDDNGNPIWPASHFGVYSQKAADWDNIMHLANKYQIVIAAGNDRASFNLLNPKAGRDLLMGTSTSKNAILVAAVNQTGTGVTMTSFSNWGPTDDGRIKPDISAKGTSVFSTDADDNTDYEYNQGTSMAAPGISGGLILFQQHYNNLYGVFMRSATLRALLINSSDYKTDDFTQTGPNFKYGYGLMNAERAVNTISNKGTSSVIEELTLTEGQVYTLNVTANPENFIKATLAWTDPAGTVSTTIIEDDPTPALVNDLDIVITQGSNEYYPWKLDLNNIYAGAIKGNNLVDNMERVDIENASGNYTIQISHKGTLSGSSQTFSLVVSGVQSTASADGFIENKIVIWPNPSSDKVNIKLLNSNIGFKITMYDSLGRTVLSDNSLTNEHTIDTNSLPRGIYTLKINNDNETYTNKILIK